MSSKVSFLALACIASCGSLSEEVSTEVCASGIRWIGGDSGDPEMKPGGDCIGCHRREDGPKFAFAGTVYTELRQDTDCYGESGVTVKITDAAGKVYSTVTNSAGNFSFSGSPKMPYTASVIVGELVIPMVTPQTNGDCNSCHTREGVNQAPGRIFISP